MGIGKWAFLLFEYGERWRTHRRLFHQFFNTARADRHDEDLSRAASKLLKNLSDNPADFHHHIQLATGSLALSISYGIRVDAPKNLYFSTAEHALKKLQEAQVPGAFPVELLPFREYSRSSKPLNMKLNAYPRIVRHFPSWLPGGGARSYGERVQRCTMDSITAPMRYATEQFEVHWVCE